MRHARGGIAPRETDTQNCNIHTAARRQAAKRKRTSRTANCIGFIGFPARASVRDAATLTRARAHTALRNAIPFDPAARAARRHAGGRARLHFNNVRSASALRARVAGRERARVAGRERARAARRPSHQIQRPQRARARTRRAPQPTPLGARARARANHPPSPTPHPQPPSTPRSAAAAALKQGAYGKVVIHRAPLAATLEEALAVAAYALGGGPAGRAPPPAAALSADRAFCEAMLAKVSRSFAAVIRALPDHLREQVCVFYLVLRGLDTVEDDMEAFAGDAPAKAALLRGFAARLAAPDFALRGIGAGDERALLENFGAVTRSLARLPPAARAVVADVCARMGAGMAAFAGRDLRGGTRDAADYDAYCHVAAGLVGEGLSALWVASGDERASAALAPAPSAAVGKFLQKVNIVRDFAEDLADGRAWWPRSTTRRYAPTLAALRPAPGAPPSDAALACLNEMVADALVLAPASLEYLAALRSDAIFAFVAVPQLMAVATLAALANNADVFTGVVKIRKGAALVLMGAATGPRARAAVADAFRAAARAVAAAVPARH
jgi:farnesyl-diphosphate farnesyltransferase